MKEVEIKNAKIRSTSLGYLGHGVVSCMIHLDYGDSAQGFGGYCFDTPEDVGLKTFRRTGTAWGMEFIIRILNTVGVERWEDLLGKHVRVKCNFSKIHEIGNIIEDKWFNPEEDLKDLKP